MKTLLFWTFLFFIFFSAPKAFAATAAANIQGTADGSTVAGTATFEDTPEGLKVRAEVSGLLAGKHGFHVHENGSCAEAGKAAGGHFNPDGTPHGHTAKDGVAHAHAGDMGNIEISADGTGKTETLLPGVTLKDGARAVAGKAVILHEKEDDFGQPTGNAGGRIGCGIIEVKE